MRIEVEVNGVDEIVIALDEVDETVIPMAAKGMGKGLQAIVAEAKALVPVDTGELRDSIRAQPVAVEGDTVTGEVAATAEHAVYVEMGTGDRGAGSPPQGAIAAGATYTSGWPGMAAQPYMYPAYQAQRDAVVQAIANAIKEGLS